MQALQDLGEGLVRVTTSAFCVSRAEGQTFVAAESGTTTTSTTLASLPEEPDELELDELDEAPVSFAVAASFVPPDEDVEEEDDFAVASLSVSSSMGAFAHAAKRAANAKKGRVRRSMLGEIVTRSSSVCHSDFARSRERSRELSRPAASSR